MLAFCSVSIYFSMMLTVFTRFNGKTPSLLGRKFVLPGTCYFGNSVVLLAIVKNLPPSMRINLQTGLAIILLSLIHPPSQFKSEMSAYCNGYKCNKNVCEQQILVCKAIREVFIFKSIKPYLFFLILIIFPI